MTTIFDLNNDNIAVLILKAAVWVFLVVKHFCLLSSAAVKWSHIMVQLDHTVQQKVALGTWQDRSAFWPKPTRILVSILWSVGVWKNLEFCTLAASNGSH